MGLFHSKKKRHSDSSVSTTTNRPSDFGDSQFMLENISDYDRNVIDELHKELKQNPDLFILNHLLMSTMFFENFEKYVHI